MKNKKPLILGLLVCALVVLFLVMSPGERPYRKFQLPDGTVVELVHVGFGTNLVYQEMTGPEWAKKLAPVLPEKLETKFLSAGLKVDLGTRLTEELMTVWTIANTNDGPSFLMNLRVRDELGNSIEISGRAQVTLSGPKELMTSWALPFLPRRSPVLFLEPSTMNNVDPGKYGTFQIENPYHGTFPRWTPETIPQRRTNESVVMSMDRFVSGALPRTMYRLDTNVVMATRMEFSFHEDGQKVEPQQIYSMEISDATGNRLYRMPNPFRQNNLAWTVDGIVQIRDMLWPGEDAWKIEVETLRKNEFALGEVWSIPSIPIAEQSSVLTLTNEFHTDALAVRLVRLELDEERALSGNSSVYFLVLNVDGDLEHRRIVVVQARDQDGRNVGILDYNIGDQPSQSLKFDVHKDVTELNLKLAFPELKTFEFIARPEFLEFEAAER